MGVLDYLVRIINLLGQVLNGTLTIQQAVQRLLDSIEKVALEHVPYRIETVTLSTNLETIDPDHGLAALKHALDGIGLAIIAMGNPQQTAVPVTLPTVPPAGYGGASSGDVATAVWNHANYSGYAMGDTMRSLVYFFDGINSNLGFPSPTGGPFVISANIGAFNDEPWRYTPDYSFDSILTTDADVGAWLNRVRGRGETWVFDSDTLLWRTFGLGQPTNNTTWYCTVTELQFAWIKAQLSGGTLALAPIWPGISGVSLLTSFDLADGLIITEAMDGVIVAITSVTSRTQLNPYGTVQSYGHIGALSFASDEGDQEDFQYLTFANQVYSPRSMKQAASIAFRVKPGIVGTVTPWTLI